MHVLALDRIAGVKPKNVRPGNGELVDIETRNILLWMEKYLWDWAQREGNVVLIYHFARQTIYRYVYIYTDYIHLHLHLYLYIDICILILKTHLYSYIYI